MRLGTELIASSKTPVWTTEHSLCSLECALLLKDWLDMISTISRSGGTEGLRPVERKLLGVLTGIIRESLFTDSLDFKEDDQAHISRWLELSSNCGRKSLKGSISMKLITLWELASKSWPILIQVDTHLPDMLSRNQIIETSNDFSTIETKSLVHRHCQPLFAQEIDGLLKLLL